MIRRENSAEIIGENCWLPLTPVRPTVFAHFELMKVSSLLYAGNIMSVEAIIKLVESFYSNSPPSNGVNILVKHAALKMMINHGKTPSDFIANQFNCRSLCQACFFD